MGIKTFKILIVDDEEAVRSVLMNYLTKKLHAVVNAVDEGMKVVETVKTWQPDLVLLDIHLPGMMGWDILREIRKFDKAVKVIVVTAILNIPPEDQEFILQETSGYLTKPMELENICAKIVEVLGPEIVKR